MLQPKDKDPLDRRMEPYIGTSVGSSHVMRNILERHQGPLGKDRKST